MSDSFNLENTDRQTSRISDVILTDILIMFSAVNNAFLTSEQFCNFDTTRAVLFMKMLLV